MRKKTRDLGIAKFSKSNLDLLRSLEQKQRMQGSVGAEKFTKKDQEKLDALYKMADFIG